MPSTPHLPIPPLPPPCPLSPSLPIHPSSPAISSISNNFIAFKKTDHFLNIILKKIPCSLCASEWRPLPTPRPLKTAFPLTNERALRFQRRGDFEEGHARAGKGGGEKAIGCAKGGQKIGMCFLGKSERTSHSRVRQNDPSPIARL